MEDPVDLDAIQTLCEQMKEIRLICDGIYARIEDLHAFLEENTQNDAVIPLDDKEQWMARFQILITQFGTFLQRQQKLDTVHRLTDSFRIGQLRAFHIDLDEICCGLGFENVASLWQDEWQTNLDAVEQDLLLAVKDPRTLYTDLHNHMAQQEALAMIKFALDKAEQVAAVTNSDNGRTKTRTVRRDDLTTMLPRLNDDTELLRLAFRRLVGFAEVEVPSLPSWFLPPNEIVFDTTSFNGGPIAHIYYGEWKRTNARLIVKRVKHCDAKGTLSYAEQSDAIVREANLLSPVKHPHVLQFVGGCHLTCEPYIVFECPTVSPDLILTLDDYLSTSIDHRRMIFRLLVQAAKGLQYLHTQHQILHGDLKCSQILIGDNGEAKLSSISSFTFQSFKVKQEEPQQHSDAPLWNRRANSLRWSSPEVLSGGEINSSADIYAFGMCVMEAISGDIPWGFTDDQSVRKQITEGKIPTRPTTVDDSVWSLIEAMCDANQTNRPDITTVVEELEALAEEEHERDKGTMPNILVRRKSSSVSSTMNDRSSEFGGGIPRRKRSSLSNDSLSDRPSFMSINSFGTEMKEKVSEVMLQQKWLGIKINSIGTSIVVSKFLRTDSGAIGEIEASGKVVPGDILYAVNSQLVRGMNRHQIGSFIHSLPRPIHLSFQRDASLLEECFRFHGLRMDERWRDRGCGINLPNSLDRMFGSSKDSFSFETWFSLTDAKDYFLGGIILGAQDVSKDDNNWPYTHRQLVMIDSNGNLVCSFLNNSTPIMVAAELELGQWYHLVLTYSDHQLQIYLDGEHRASDAGVLHHDWQRLRYVNIGTGCISGLSPAKPSPGFSGWYGFSGLVHDFKIWRKALTDIEVKQLFRGARNCVDTPNYSLMRDARKSIKEQTGPNVAQLVRASRPQHVVAQVYG